jgi:hypothetical protein
LNVENIYDGKLDENKFGSEAFKFDFSNLRFPIVQQPGEFIEFDAQFVGRKKGLHSAKITTISDAEAEVVSNWTGYGIEQGIVIKGSMTYACVSTPAQMTATVTNTGTTDIRVDSVVFDPAMSEFKWNYPAQTRNFILPAMTSKELVIEFKSDAKGTYQTEIKAYNNTLFDPIVKATVIGNARHFNRATRLIMADNRFDRVIPVGGMIYRRLLLDPGEDISWSHVQELDIQIHYNAKFFCAEPSTVSLGGLVFGECQIKSLTVDDPNGLMQLRIALINPNDAFNYTEGGELLSFGLKTNPPEPDSASLTITHTVEAISDGEKTPCVDFSMINTSVNIDSTVVFKTTFPDIVPFPIDSRGSEMKFTLLQEGMTEIEIFDLRGKLIAKLMDDVLPVGKYVVHLPSESMAPGVYYLRFKTGTFEEIKKLMVVR